MKIKNLLYILGIFFCSACKLYNNSSKIDHNISNLKGNDNPLLWVQLSDEFIKNNFPNIISISLAEEFFAEKVDLLFKKMKAIDPSINNLPIPKVRLVKSDEQNAFSYSVRICLPIKLAINEEFAPNYPSDVLEIKAGFANSFQLTSTE